MKTFILFLVLGTLLGAHERTQVHMGTLISVRVDDENLSDKVFDLFRDLDQRLSTYKSDSEISRLNRNEDINVSALIREVLARSVEMNRLTHGAFDVTIGSLSHGAYHFGAKERLPTSAEINHALTFVGEDHLKIDHDRVHVTPGTIIDLGGIGKGFAVDKSIELLMQHGITKAVIAASGDIGCLGECEVKITDPFHPNAFIATVTSSLSRFAISTSGNYERYIRNKKHNHLLDPKTGKSEQRFASVTLMGEGDNTALDALSTAVAVMDEKEGMALLKSISGVYYYLVHNDGRVVQSKNLKNWMGVCFSRGH
ncbi:FAD:protein FMN transferase [Sulfuricurvum sp.]|uniref:FAD:protein FMN transferase n=1 Tax=Sulfuricurvum sp. TaxID=2025608 RepID=UPI0035663F9F